MSRSLKKGPYIDFKLEPRPEIKTAIGIFFLPVNFTI